MGATRGRSRRGDPARRRRLVSAGVKALARSIANHGHDPHIAIQESLGGKVVDWMEKVSDEQYRK
jgi:hypothetical protein